ncbi:MAG: Fe(3+) ABC transporter substrate-binding protein [Proteocatella sp.]
MKFKVKSKIAIAMVSVLSLAFLAGCGTKEEAAIIEESGVVNVYSARHYDVDKEVFLKFEDETGIKVNVIEGKAPELLERMKREGADTQADIFITADMANIYQTIDSQLTQSVDSEIVDSNIPENLRGENNEWIALTQRARVIAYDKEKVNPQDLSTYEDLTSDRWSDKILVRGSDSTYNQSLLASFIELNGEEAAKEWAAGLVSNMAREPEGGDRDQVKAVAAGEGELAILNTYYLGLMINSEDPEEVKVAESVGVFFPEPTHVNISGVVVNKYSKNTENAVKLIEYITSEEVQQQYTDKNYEYPANPNVEPTELLKSWGGFTPQDIKLSKLGEYNKKAVEIFNEVGWK